MTRKKPYQLCLFCGQAIPPEIDVPLGPVTQRIFKLLLERPRSAEELRDLTGCAALYGNIMNLRAKLRPYGFKICRKVRGEYWLEEIK